MPDHIEQNLRAALSQHAAQLDPDAITRLRAIDYHPRLGVFATIRRSLARRRNCRDDDRSAD
jgi:hypothetical protein